MTSVGVRSEGVWRFAGWRGPLQDDVEFRDVHQIVYSTDNWVTWQPFAEASFAESATFRVGLMVRVDGLYARANTLQEHEVSPSTAGSVVEWWLGTPYEGGTLLRSDDYQAPYDLKADGSASTVAELGGVGQLRVSARIVYPSDDRVDVRLAVATATSVGSPPLSIFSGPSVTPAVSSAIVSLTASNPVTSLTVEYRVVGAGSWLSTTVSGQSTTSPLVTLTGLTAATSYEFRIPTGGVVDVYSQTTQDTTVRPFTTSEVSDVTHGHQLNASNTGVIGAGYSYGDLTPSGSITTTSNGQVIEFMDVTGSIDVRHNNVTIRYCRVRGSTAYKINFSTGTPVTGTRVEWCELVGATSAGLVHFSPYYAYRCNIWGSVDSIKAGTGCSVVECWAHDHVVILLPNGQYTHNDAVQIRNGNNINVLRSRLECNWQTQTGGILAQAADGNITNLMIADNALAGGSASLYLINKGFTISGTVVTGNWFAGNTTIRSYYRDGDEPDAFDARNSWRESYLSKNASGVTSSNNWLAPVINYADTSNPYKPGTPSFPLQLDGTDLRAVTV